MDPVGNNPYQSAFVQTPLPSVQQQGNGGSIVLNMTLTIPEVTFLAFSVNMIRTSLSEKNDLIYLGTSEPMQKSFSEWVAKTFTNRKFSLEELKLDTIVSSIWAKVKTFNENELRVSNNLQAITDENRWQAEANSYEVQFRLQGRTGKFFTARQATALLKATDSIGQ